MMTTQTFQRWRSQRSLWADLRTNPLAVLTLIVFAVFIGIWTLPFVPEQIRVTVATIWADPIVIILSLAGFLLGIGDLRPEERRFWGLLAAAFVCASGGRLVAVTRAGGTMADT
jgi:hypothetical protein